MSLPCFYKRANQSLRSFRRRRFRREFTRAVFLSSTLTFAFWFIYYASAENKHLRRVMEAINDFYDRAYPAHKALEGQDDDRPFWLRTPQK